jgi:hypothetical protein
MHTAFLFLASSMPWLVVHFDLQSVHQLVEAAEKIDHGHNFENCFVIKPQFSHRGNMYGESVVASHYG